MVKWVPAEALKTVLEREETGARKEAETRNKEAKKSRDAKKSDRSRGKKTSLPSNKSLQKVLVLSD